MVRTYLSVIGYHTSAKSRWKNMSKSTKNQNQVTIALEEQTISCPNCKAEFLIKEGLSSLAFQALKEEFAKREEADREVWKKTTFTRLQQEIAKRNKSSLNNAEKIIQERERKAATEEAAVKIAEEKRLMNNKFQEQQAVMQRLEAEKEKAQEEEIKLRSAKRALEEEKKNIKISVERQVDERVSQQAARQDQLHQERLKEKELEMINLRKLLKEAELKSSQGSQQLQGEAREQIIEETISKFCPLDRLEPIPTGKRGADILQLVIQPNGSEAGRIIWESKKVKNWKSDFVDKLKSDQQSISADLAVLVTNAFPKDASNEPFQRYQNIWLIQPQYVGSFAQVLRQQIINVSHSKQVAEQRGDYKDVLYDHIFSGDFVSRMKQVHDLMERQRIDLVKEKSQSDKLFAKREKQIEATMSNFMEVIGGLGGLGRDCPPGLEQIGTLTFDEDK